ncbi:hypothetical protein NMG60_11026063 [Bertholletia excelsa]
MANPGGVGTKFVSVNLNKSYGPPSHGNSTYGQGRVRQGSHASGGGGGMVVLSRPRSSQKAGAKLSVPPPLNLPSLRKEHERFDLSGPGGGLAGSGNSSSGSRPTSSGVGWVKTGPVGLQEKEGNGGVYGKSGGDAQAVDGIDQGMRPVDALTRGSATYMPPSARFGGFGENVLVSAPLSEKISVLRGEDFPSLKAALPSSAAGPIPKQKDGLHKKEKNMVGEESLNDQTDSYHLSSLAQMRPQGQSSSGSVGTAGNRNGAEGHGLGSSQMADQARKKEDYFPVPLPLVRVNPRSEWADDERDTGTGFADRDRDHRFSKSEAYWDREFDMTRNSILPHKLAHNSFERRVKHGDEIGKSYLSEVPKMDPYRREARTSSREGREGNSWRNSAQLKEGLNVQEVANGKNDVSARPLGVGREIAKENKYVPPHFGDNSRDGVTGSRESLFGRRDMGQGRDGRHQWNKTVESSISRGTEWNARDCYVNDQSNKYKGEVLQDCLVSKSSVSSAGKVLPSNDLILSFHQEKSAFSKSERIYSDEPFGTMNFDERDPFSGGFVGIIKRKKDVIKQTDFRDPVRESFEAELERVQKLQEEERQRAIEEQERAIEQARREEEERQRLIREEEERRRRLEEEAREAAWRAEQECLEAIRRAEEQKMAREEEKHRILMEEERRKQAAKQKLLELEARMAKRHAEATKCDDSAASADEKVSGLVTEKEVSMAGGLDSGDNWEDNERMVERVIASGSSDSSRMNRPFELGPGPHLSREGSSGLLDRGKPANSWRRDVFENGNNSSFLAQEQDNGDHRLNQDVGRAFPRKEFFEGGSYISPRTYFRGGMQEPQREDFTSLKRHQWNASGDGDSFSRKTDIDELHENLAERYGDVGWGQGRSLGNVHSFNAERLYSEADELYSYGRSRYSMRQPRVLPPPLVSTQRPSYRRENEHPGPSTFHDNNIPYHSGSRSESTMERRYYVSQHEKFDASNIIDVQSENIMAQEQKLEKRTTPRCDSQSSLSVSSPPSSPTHLSHEDLDESGDDSPVLPDVAEGKDVPLSGNENIVLKTNSGKGDVMTHSVSISAADADDEDWAVGKDEALQEQDEYDEDEDGFQEEDEVHDGGDEHLDLSQEFEDLHLEEDGSSCMVENLVLGFNEGVEVGIPDDEFERSSRNEDNIMRIPGASVGIIEEQGVGGSKGDGVHLQNFDNSGQMQVDISSRRSKEIERAIQDSVDLPINTADHSFSASDHLDSVDHSISSGICAQLLSPSSVDISHSSSSQTVMSTVPIGHSQTDLPVKLQFGLFSGPSLIPSPVPAIQIGSIQMPLHLHPPIGPSLTHMHPSQPPLFQFGQFRYTSPISQGILPLAPQSMSFVQPNVQARYNLNQSSGGPLPNQPCLDNSAHSLAKDDLPSVSTNQETAEGIGVIQDDCAEYSHSGEDKLMSQKRSVAENKGHQATEVKNNILSSNVAVSVGHLQTGPSASLLVSNEKDSKGLKARGPQYASRGKRFSHLSRNSGPRPSSVVSGVARSDSIEFQRRLRRTIQRTEFRVRENVDRRQASGLLSSNNLRQDDKSNFSGSNVGIFVKSGSKKELIVNKPLKPIVEHEGLISDRVSSQRTSSENMPDKKVEKESSLNTQRVTHSREGNLKRELCSEEDADAPLQTGIVRIFKQPGIETPSDEDNFIEVRSKRQMLNDRREQREKEIKAKTQITKAPRKPRSSARNAIISVSSDKTSARLSGEARSSIRTSFVPSEGQGLLDVEVCGGFSTAVSQPLAPIGTPAVNSEMQTDKTPHNAKSHQTNHTAISNGGKALGPGLMFEAKNSILDDVQTSVGPWGSGQFNKQVKALVQTQLDDAMKPGRFDSHVASIGEHTSSVAEPIMSSSSMMPKEKSFSSAASPINSLLAGERIQFGAVTSPTVLPEHNSAVSHGIGAPGSYRSEIQISHNLSAAESDTTLFFEKDKLQNEVCLEDCEAEAEAAASAVAVAAISSDETVGSVLGTTAVSVSDSKNFNSADTDGISGGVSDDQQLATQSRAEEPLNVSLPADLSVETPPISLWPALPSPQNSSAQMLPHFPGGPPSHFPFYEMNAMLGGPIFAFGQNDESAGNHSQSQKNTVSASGPLGTWQQCHSGLESFYGPPSGFSGPYITPPGGMPGVQGPPPMLVYNHFPVGQFGQVGLSFMGPTYIQSGKQPDWKHSSTSSMTGISEGDIKNINMVSAQRNAPSMSTSAQHLAPGSPLLPVASPLRMYDVAPFQSPPDMSVQGRWPHHIPSPPLHSIRPSLQLQQKEAGVLPSQFTHGRPIDESLTATRFSETRTLAPSDSRNFPLAADSTTNQFPNELGLGDLSSSAGETTSAQGAVTKSCSGGSTGDIGKTDAVISNSSGHSTNAYRTHSVQQKNLSAGYSYQKGGMSQKNGSANDWSNRRMGFQGRNQSLGGEKNYPSLKMKQIYVAKQTASGTNTVA